MHLPHLSAAAIPSQLVNTSDKISPASTLDTHPPPRSIATATQMIQPTYYTTLPLQNLPVTSHNQQFSLAQQIPAWPTMVQLNSNLTLVLITHDFLAIFFESLISDRVLFASNSCSVT